MVGDISAEQDLNSVNMGRNLGSSGLNTTFRFMQHGTDKTGALGKKESPVWKLLEPKENSNRTKGSAVKDGEKSELTGKDYELPTILGSNSGKLGGLSSNIDGDFRTPKTSSLYLLTLNIVYFQLNLSEP